MTYSYDRRTAAANQDRTNFLEKYVRQAKAFPKPLRDVADALKAPSVAEEAAKIEVRIQDVERLIGYLKNPSDMNMGKARALAKKLAREDQPWAKSSVTWGILGGGGIVFDTGLGKRLEANRPDDRFRDFVEELAQSLKG